MNNLSAALGCAQMEEINTILKAKRRNFKKYFYSFRNSKYLKIDKSKSNEL